MDQPKIDLPPLREIGRREWEPIEGALLDEYDEYLLAVTDQLKNGASEADAIAYLEHVEIERMGCGRSATTRSRAEATVAAIAASLASPRTD